MKTAISIPDDIFAKAEEAAQKLGMSRSELYTRAVDKFVEAYRREAVTEALNALYSEEDSHLDAAFARAQTASVCKE